MAAHIHADGHAYVFRRTVSTWPENAHFTAGQKGLPTFYGETVALDARVAILGTESDDTVSENAGAALVYEYDACLKTRVADATALPFDLLYVNGQTGGTTRTAEAAKESIARRVGR